MTGQIYFLSNSMGAIKIGYSRSLKSRMRSLQTSAAMKLDVIALIPGGRDLESFIHRSLTAHRLNGEWFRDCDAVRAFIADVVSLGPGALGFVSGRDSAKKQAKPDAPLFDEFERLVAIIKACAPNPHFEALSEVLRGIERQFGFSNRFFWNFTYRPRTDISMRDFMALQKAARHCLDRASERLRADDAWLSANEAHCEARSKSIRECEDEIERLRAQLCAEGAKA